MSSKITMIKNAAPVTTCVKYIILKITPSNNAVWSANVDCRLSSRKLSGCILSSSLLLDLAAG